MTRALCKELNEHLIVPLRSDVMTIEAHETEVGTDGRMRRAGVLVEPG